MADEMRKSDIVHVVDEWPTGLIKAEDVAAKTGIDATRLLNLAYDGYVPHYRVDKGEPQFKLTEVKRWAAKNMLNRINGRDLPEPIVVAQKPRANPVDLPYELQCVPNIRDMGDFLVGSGIYFLCKKTDIRYIGQSVNITARVTQHVGLKDFDRVLFLPWPKDDLSRIEGAFIRILRPPLNITVRGTPAAPAAGQNDVEVLRSLNLLPTTLMEALDA